MWINPQLIPIGVLWHLGKMGWIFYRTKPVSKIFLILRRPVEDLASFQIRESKADTLLLKGFTMFKKSYKILIMLILNYLFNVQIKVIRLSIFFF